jgi:hypothetical protein
MSQQWPYGPPPGMPVPNPYYPPIPPTKRPGWWKRRALSVKILLVLGALFGAFALFIILLAIFLPPTPEMQATATAKAEARATGTVATATAKEERQTTSTAAAVAGLRSTQDSSIRAATSAPTATPKPSPSTKPTVVSGRAEALSQCMHDNFGGGPQSNGATSWYPNISTYRISGTRVDVDTTLFWRDTNKPVATNIRAGVITCAREIDPTINWVAVNAGNGDVLVSGAVPGAT